MTESRGGYDGLCNLCGYKGRFEGDLRRAREQFRCPSCGATLRYRDQAAAILEHFAEGGEVFLDRFVRTPAALRLHILEAAIRGPFIRRFRHLPHYTQTYLFADVPLGGKKNGILCEDLENLTIADHTMDLVVTSDVFEHVADPRRAIAEVARILKPGGAHVFSIPIRWPIEPASRVRCRLVGDRVEHLLEPRYHRSGLDEPSLVFTDFGADLLAWHAAVGLRARFFNSHRMIDSIGRFPSVIAVKPARDLADV
jgi:hypothetical protein